VNLVDATILYDAAYKLSSQPFNIDSFCFDKQLSFIKDPAYYATAVCSVRAGKTTACAADLISTALNRPKVTCLYLTLARTSAKRIVWPVLLQINRDYNLGAKVNESELSLKFSNGSIIYVSGASDRAEIEKWRGIALALCYIDEAQAFGSYLGELTDEVIAKRLYDYAGRLRLIGTPGPVKAGYFWSCCESKQWAHHKWTMFDNPHLPAKSGQTQAQLVQRDLERKGVSINHPSIRRECFGEWAYDPEALVFKYDPDKNHCDPLSVESLTHHPWNYIIGIDIGFDDADAICVLGYNERLKAAYLFEEVVKNKQGITELVDDLRPIVERYKPDKIVMDTGGLGKKIAEEVTRRYSIFIDPAEKARKFEFIEILNDAMRTQKFFASRHSRFAEDCMRLEWEREEDKRIYTPSEKPRIRDNYHSDICDSVLYAFRECYHWLYQPQEPKVLPGSAEWFKKEEIKLEETVLEGIQRTKELDPWAYGDINDFGQ